ncbi:MAG: rRNA maturation RNase YbeY [Clostridia bacterium]|nr:rRNA maturation RNase YbeY [Clostridia bacterium]
MKVTPFLIRPRHAVRLACNDVCPGKELEQAALKSIRATLAYQQVVTPCEIELIFCGEEEIRSINAQTRSIDAVTDVLSFPMLGLVPGEDPGEAATAADYSHGFVGLGSIVICLPRAESQAREYGHSLKREVAFLAAHSVLHLLGFDHGEEREGEMFDLQKKILNAAGFKRI